MRSRRRRAFTLIELLVVVSLIGVIASLILPAVQDAREAARRAQCADHLKQLALALAGYEAASGCYPMAFYYQLYPGGFPADGAGPLVALLPYYEQSPLYNAWNGDLGLFCDSNATVGGAGVGLLWCPSDEVQEPWEIPIGEVYGNARPYPIRYASYAGCMGYWTGRIDGSAGTSTQRAQALGQHNGAFVSNGYGAYGHRFSPSRVGVSQPPARLADVTDGLSQTLAFAEHAHGLLGVEDGLPGAYWHWWASGNYGDSTFTTFYPINPTSIPGRGDGPDQGGPMVNGASSFHPGGVNAAFCDGSVRFIKDSIDSWPFDADAGLPTGVSRLPGTGVWRLAPGAKVGVWQALGSRGGGEVVGADQF